MAAENSDYTRMTEESARNQQTNANQMQMQIGAGRISPRNRQKGKLYGLGIAECVLGGLTIILGITANAVAASENRRYYYYYTVYSFTSQGIWGGILLITSGILGVVARKKPSVGIFQANMTLSIISSVFASVGVILSGIACTSWYSSLRMIHIFILLLLFSGMIVCIIHSAFCCAGLCGSNTTTSSAVMYVPQQVVPTQQFIQLPNGQLAAIVGNAATPQLYPVTGGMQSGFVTMQANQVFQPPSSQVVMNPFPGHSVKPVSGASSLAAPVIQTNCPSNSENSGNTEPPGYSTMPK